MLNIIFNDRFLLFKVFAPVASATNGTINDDNRLKKQPNQ
jgi:hypothetical protein